MTAKIKWHLDPMRVVWFGFCPSAAVWESERKRVLRRAHLDLGDYPKTPGNTTHWREEDEVRCLVTMTPPLKDSRRVSTLAHESYHVVCTVVDEMADKNPSEEFMAYTLGHVVNALYPEAANAWSSWKSER